jgi:hypothetical protein
MAINTTTNTTVSASAGSARTSIVPPTGDRSAQFGQVRQMRHRLVVLASGLQKHGKNHWGFTAPGPIALHAFDEGWDDTANKFIKGFAGSVPKIIKVCEYDVPEAVDKKRSVSLEEEADKIWSNFVANYRWSLDNFRSVIIDTSTEMWELLRLARFGALSTGQTTSFGPVNAEMRKLLREAYNHNANVIFLQKLGKNYVNREWDGTYTPKGFGDMAYEVQVVVRLWREDPNVFHAMVEDCRQKPELNGTDFDSSSGLNTFATLGSLIYDDSPKEWQ